jgi:hypothetical protein
MKLITCPKLRMSRLWVVLAAIAAFVPQLSQAAPRKPGVREVQVPFSSLNPVATIKVGRTADWVLVTENAVLQWRCLDHGSREQQSHCCGCFHG